MSSMTYGPPAVLDSPLPAPLQFGLFSAAMVVSEPNERWANGARIYGYPEGPPEAWDACSTGTFRIKAEGDVIASPVFGAFGLYLAETCTARGIGGEAAFAERAALAFAAVEQYGVETEFSQGLAMPSNPYLADTNADIIGAAVGPAEALALLEEAIGDTGKAGVIHAGRGTVSAWSSLGALRIVGDKLLTYLGTPVAAGGGYQNAIPDGGANPSIDQGWTWATGPVEVRRSPQIELLPGSLAEALDRESNTVTYRAERIYLVTWDTALQSAVLVDRSL